MRIISIKCLCVNLLMKVKDMKYNVMLDEYYKVYHYYSSVINNKNNYNNNTSISVLKGNRIWRNI